MALSEAALMRRYFGGAAAAAARAPPAAHIFASLGGSIFRAPAPAPSHVSAEEALLLLHEEHVVFVDTREPAEVASSGCIPGALRISRHTLALHVDTLKHSGHIVAYGANQSKSMQAGKMLRALGFKDVSAMGSYRDWVDAGGPIQRPPLTPIGVPTAAQM